jgi:hypothetical protein
MSSSSFNQTFDNNVLYAFFGVYAFVILFRQLSHWHSRYLQHIERMDGQTSASISDGPTDNIPSIM